MAVIGLDLGATKLNGALFAPDGSIVERTNALLEGRGGDVVGHLIVDQLERLLKLADSHGNTVKSVGVSVPGIAHHDGDRVWAPNIPGWESYPLAELLGSKRPADCSLSIESDRACSILGEVSKGAARGCRNAVFLAVGTGIGAGILMDGKILRGAHDIAGAIGWIALDRPYRDVYERCGRLRVACLGGGNRSGRPGISGRRSLRHGAVIEAESRTDHGPRGIRGIPGGRRPGRSRDRERRGMLGHGAGERRELLNPEVVIFGGGMFGPATVLLDRIRTEAKRWAQPVSFSKVLVAASQLGADACLHGTGELARRATLED